MDELKQRGRGFTNTAAGREMWGKAKVWGKRRRIKGVARGAQKWGAWETRGEDCCRWVGQKQVQEGWKLKASTQDER